jgi:hypothetical protein
MGNRLLRSRCKVEELERRRALCFYDAFMLASLSSSLVEGRLTRFHCARLIHSCVLSLVQIVPIHSVTGG